MIRIIDEELREACAIGDETKAQMLIGQGANVNSSNKVNGWTALHWAAYRGHRGLVMYLLNKGADPTIQNSKGETVMSLLSNYSLDLLDGKEVDEAKQYPLPSQQETLNNLPIMPNYIKNPEFPYSTKKDPHLMMNSGPPPNHTAGAPLHQKQSGMPKGPGMGPQGAGPPGAGQTARPMLVQVPSSQGNRSNSSSPQLPSSTNNMSKQNCKTEKIEMETDICIRPGNLAPSMLASSSSSSSSPKPSSRYQLPHSKASPNWTFSGPSHRPSMITAQPLFPTQIRPGQIQIGPGHHQLVPNPGPHRYPVSSIPVSSEFPIQRIMRPGYVPPAASIPSGYGAPPGPPPGYGGPSAATGAAPGGMGVVPPGNMVHWGFNTPPHFRPQAGMVPQPIQPAASQSPSLPTSPQVVNIPDSTQDKEMTTPVKDSPVCSPSANSTNSSPSADATIKVRLAGSEDFFEVELSDIGDTYNSLVKCLAEELDVKSETVTKIRKLPNILIRKDRDVKRIKSGSEFEVELHTES